MRVFVFEISSFPCCPWFITRENISQRIFLSSFFYYLWPRIFLATYVNTHKHCVLIIIIRALISFSFYSCEFPSSCLQATCVVSFFSFFFGFFIFSMRVCAREIVSSGSLIREEKNTKLARKYPCGGTHDPAVSSVRRWLVEDYSSSFAVVSAEDIRVSMTSAKKPFRFIASVCLRQLSEIVNTARVLANTRENRSRW